MASAFNKNPGKQAFGVFKESDTAGDYIFNKKAKTTFCPKDNCVPCNNFPSQSNLLLAKKVSYNKKLINTSNLDINLITELNLKDVNIFQTFDMSSSPYYYYNIDPSGKLFGNTICGTNNFMNYLEYNPKYNNKNNGTNIL
jgi:hypothetical protein